MTWRTESIRAGRCSGGGIAKGQLDANKGLYQNGVPDNTWSGGFATSKLGHLTIDVGYFVSRDLLLSVGVSAMHHLRSDLRQ